jgi:hypothetical protein
VRRNWRTLRTKRRAGTELIELALILGVVLLPIVFGTIEFGTYFYVEHNLQGAAREAARAACVLPQDQWGDAAIAAVERVREGSSLNQFDGFETELNWEELEDANGRYVAVTVSATWDKVPQGLRPMLMIRDAENHELRGYAVMRWEAAPSGIEVLDEGP